MIVGSEGVQSVQQLFLMYQYQFCGGILKVCDLVFILPPSYSMLIKMDVKAVNLSRQLGGMENAGSEEEWV